MNQAGQKLDKAKFKDILDISKRPTNKIIYKKEPTVTGYLQDLLFLEDDVIKSATFFSTACPFSEAFLCALETRGLPRS